MPKFHNNPTLTNRENEGMVKRYKHQPLTFDHYGIKVAIKENGKVTISSRPVPVAGSPDEVEYDEVEVPASLVFKLAMLLSTTRTIEFVPVAEGAKDIESLASDKE